MVRVLKSDAAGRKVPPPARRRVRPSLFLPGRATMNPDEVPPTPPKNRAFIQPSRRSRIGRRTPTERRIPGSPDTGEREEENASTETDEEFHDPDEHGHTAREGDDASPVPEGDAGADTGEAPTHAPTYRPPGRGADVTWSGGQAVSSPDDPDAPTPAVTRFAPAGDAPPARPWLRPAMLVTLGLLLGGALGYGLGRAGAGNGPDAGGTRRAFAAPTPPPTLSPLAGALATDVLAAVDADVDAAFTALKAGRFDDARARLRAAQERRPAPAPTFGGGITGLGTVGAVGAGGWPSLEVENARTFFYAGNPSGADTALDAHLRTLPVDAFGARADALLLRALVQGAMRNPAFADQCFAAAASADPARADIYFFWGNALRNEGKPLEAAAHFRSALLRNQFETIDGLYRLKLWLSQLQIDDTQAAEASAAIDAALAPKPPAEPTGYAFLGAAARALRAGDYAAAGGFIARARTRLEPVILRVTLSDPTFAQENWRPELAGFFR